MVDFIVIERPGRRKAMPLPAEHPELDEPDSDLNWDRWLEGRQRLETTLLFNCR